MKKIVIVDYKMSNLYSVKHAFRCLGIDATITSRPHEIAKADGLVLPGVGAFGNAMKNLHDLSLIPALSAHIKHGKPFMGVCLGMQLLFSDSEEFGIHKGLNFLQGHVVKFPSTIKKRKVKIPCVGWNTIHVPKGKEYLWKKSPLRNIHTGSFMYFVHSFYVVPLDTSIICTQTNYSDCLYCSSVLSGNIFAVQFHPEKSGLKGISVYKEWLYYV